MNMTREQMIAVGEIIENYIEAAFTAEYEGTVVPDTAKGMALSALMEIQNV